MGTENALRIETLEKSFFPGQGVGTAGKQLMVLSKISMSINEGEFVGLLGPSGCGKSTLLNIVAGFIQADKGLVLFQGLPVTRPSPERSVLFQDSVLFPWLTVKENIIYGLKNRKEKREIIEEKYLRTIQLVELNGFDHFYPKQLSGGMQQRAALARVLIMESPMLLMDEPFASLDAQTRMLMQQLLLDIEKEIRPTILMVTHDIEEALILSDRILIMGKLPGQIIHEVKVPFSRPRDLSMIGKSEFGKIKDELRRVLFDCKSSVCK
ncbi:ABC transporter ATP-binding protein [Acetobacterium woodii]|nr:ABC transporter ATP-binding protein [Acetobacterium woodii]